MSIIRDPNTGQAVEVTDEGRIKSDCVTQTMESHTNQDEEEAYNAVFAVNPDAAGDCIFYLKNNSDNDIKLEGVWWQTSAAEEVYYKLAEVGTAVKTAGADITPGNMNSGSGNVADCDCYSNVGDGAVDITGLTGGRTVQSLYLTSAESKYFNCEMDIFVQKNQTFSIYAIGGDTLLRGTVVFHFHD